MPETPFPNFPKTGIVCAVSSCQSGNMSFTYGDTTGAKTNREKFLEKLGISCSSLVCAKQTHSDHIRRVTREDRGKGALSYDTAIEDTDGFITDEPGLPLAVFTADCLSVFLYDPKNPAIGIVHAGWRSSAGKIIAKAVRLMREEFKSKPEGLLAAFGPGIRSCCCEVGDDLEASFPGGVVRRGGKLYLDLPEINKIQLLSEGIKEQNIFDPGNCTFCGKKRFFSFRREGDKSGRMISVISLTV